MFDKKNSVLFTKTECLILSPDFKLIDESQVLLKVPRQNNMYSFDLKNVVPLGGLTCLFTKATIDEFNLWHRRLGHINFKTMNKLVRGNLVRGLPSKLFENDHTCVACQKGKQHKASVADDAGKKTNEEPANEGERNGYANCTNRDSTVSPSVSTVGQNFTNVDDLPTDPPIPDLEDTGIFSGAYDDDDVGVEADLNNLDTTMNIEAMQEELLQFKLQRVWTLVDLPKGKRAIGTKWVYRNKKDKRGIVVRNKARLMDVKSAFLYGTIEEEVYVCQHPSFEDPQFPDKMSSIGELTFFLGLQVMQKDDGIFISQDMYVADILKKFNFVTINITSTPIETNKALLKDEEAEDMDVYLYRSMIGSLMYLTTSRPDIMFNVYACARFQVTPKVSHLYAVKRIFRYLKGQPKLGLWYPMDPPFDLEAFSDSDYAGPSLDRKSTTGAEYVAAANCYGQVLWIQNQMLDYRFNFVNTKIHIDNESIICIVKNLVFHSKTKHIKIWHHFIRDSYEKKLIQVIKIQTDHNVAYLLTKAFDVSRKAKRTTKISQSSGPIHLDADETIYKEWEDRIERATTTPSSLEAEQDSEIGVNADVLKLMLLSLKLNAAKLKLMLLGLIYYCPY
ncbi:putative ribonuclease H-like domain-containing protein [Tanacetum coccineum]